MRVAATAEELAWDRLVGRESLGTVRTALTAFATAQTTTSAPPTVHLRFS